MAKILVTPIVTDEYKAIYGDIEPFEVEGKELMCRYFDECGLIYYIGGKSFPEAIVTILEGEVENDL